MVKNKNICRAIGISFLMIFGLDFAAQADLAQQSIFTPALESRINNLKSQIQSNISWAQQKYVFSNDGLGGVTVIPLDPANNPPAVLYMYLAKSLRDTRSVLIDSQKAIDAAIKPATRLTQNPILSVQDASAFRIAFSQAIAINTEICNILQNDLLGLFSSTLAQGQTTFLEAATAAVNNTPSNAQWKAGIGGETQLNDTRSYLPVLNSEISQCRTNIQSMRKTLDDFNNKYGDRGTRHNEYVQANAKTPQIASCAPPASAKITQLLNDLNSDDSVFASDTAKTQFKDTFGKIAEALIKLHDGQSDPANNQFLNLYLEQHKIVGGTRAENDNTPLINLFKKYPLTAIKNPYLDPASIVKKSWDKAYNDCPDTNPNCNDYQRMGSFKKLMTDEIRDRMGTENLSGTILEALAPFYWSNPAERDAFNADLAKIENLKLGTCPANPVSNPSSSAPQLVSCSPLSDVEINNIISNFQLGTLNSTTMSPNARLDLAKKVQDFMSMNGNPFARPLAREISGTANEEDHKSTRLAIMQNGMIDGSVNPLLAKHNINQNNTPNLIKNLYRDGGTPQYGDTLQAYLNTLGIPEAESKPVIDNIKALKFASNCPATVTMKAPTSPDQMVPCGPVTTKEMQTIFPKHTITLNPPKATQAEIATFKSQLNTMFNAKDNVKPEYTKFYQNVMLWANNQLTPERHQLLRYTIEQLKILLGTYAPETFNFKSESEKFAPEIDTISPTYWEQFYGIILANTKLDETGRLVEALENMNNTLSRPLDPNHKIGPDAQGALLDIISKLKALKLASCPTTFAAPPPPPSAPPAVAPPPPPSAPKPAVPLRSAPTPAPKPAAPKPAAPKPAAPKPAAPKPAAPKPAAPKPAAPKPAAPKPAAPKPAAPKPAAVTNSCPMLSRENIFRALNTTIAAMTPPKVGRPEAEYKTFDQNLNSAPNINKKYGGTTAYDLLKKAARGTPLTAVENKALSTNLNLCK